MEYRKERNFIVAYSEMGNEYQGKWDFLTNQYYGIRGNVVKTRPHAFSVTVMDESRRHMDEDTPISALLGFFTNYRSDFDKYFTEQIGQRLEAVVSVGLCVDGSYGLIRFLAQDTTTLNKECVQFLKDKKRGIYSSQNIKSYSILRKYTTILNSIQDDLEYNWAMDILQEAESRNIPETFVISMINRGLHEKIYMRKTGWDFSGIIRNWYVMLTDMNEKLEAPHNILTEDAILIWRYNKFKEEHYDELLRTHNDKPFLYYENEKYIVRPLLSRNEFHIEATEQQNCVERSYLDDVARGRTHVVGIRLKSNPNHPYITCEVNLERTIWQYRLRQNRPPVNDDDKEFQRIYQKHLFDTLQEGQK